LTIFLFDVCLEHRLYKITGGAELEHGRLLNICYESAATERTALPGSLQKDKRTGLPRTLYRQSPQTAFRCFGLKSGVVNGEGKGRTRILSGEGKEDECKLTTDEVSKSK
jgi:hypothetical protein